MNKNKILVVVGLGLLVFSLINPAFALEKSDVSVSSDSKTSTAVSTVVKPAVTTISTPVFISPKVTAEDQTKPIVNNTVISEKPSPITITPISSKVAVSAADVTPGFFNSNFSASGNYGFPGNISLVPTTNTASSSGVIYKGTNRFIHDFYIPGTAGKNTFVGINSGNLTVTGSVSSWEGSYNTGMGDSTLTNNTIGSYNTASGYQALSSNIGGSYNTANGAQALRSNTTGSNNIAMGLQSLSSNTSGDSNAAIGAYALNRNTAGSFNTATGYQALSFNTTGNFNTANGLQSLYFNTTGNYNVANGRGSLYSNTTGSNNSAYGYQSLDSNTTGSYNTAYGMNSGTNNTVALETMTNSTFLGYGANSSVNGITNSMALGAGAQVTKSNQVVIGNGSVTETVLNGKVLVGNRLCIWNGASYTSISFAPNSATPIYSTSTACQF